MKKKMKREYQKQKLKERMISGMKRNEKEAVGTENKEIKASAIKKNERKYQE